MGPPTREYLVTFQILNAIFRSILMSFLMTVKQMLLNVSLIYTNFVVLISGPFQVHDI